MLRTENLNAAKPQEEKTMAKNKNTSPADDAVQRDVSAALAAQPARFKRIGAVTVPTLKMEEGKPVYVKITGAIQTKPKMDKGGIKLDENGNPASISLVPVINLDTGEIMTLVAGKGLEQNLKEYQGGGERYVGLCFEITKHPSAAGKRWKPYSIFEIDGTPAGEGKV